MMNRIVYIRHGIILTTWIVVLFLARQKSPISLRDTISSRDISSIVSETHDNQTNSGSKQQVANYNNIDDKESSLSLQNIMSNISTYGNSLGGSGLVSTDKLLELYKKSPTIELTIQLIEQLNREFAYNEAYNILQENPELRRSVDTKTILRILLNSKIISSKTHDFSAIQSFIEQSQSANKLTTAEAEWYLSLLDLVLGKKENLLNIVKNHPELNGSEQQTAELLQKRINYASQGRDMAAYYQDGMIALSLFEHGYIAIGQQLSLQLLANHPDYILPKQILAYTHIILHERREAKSYFIELISLDPTNSSHYQLFVGVSSYRMDDFTDAILYLSQIDNSIINTDAIRYKLLSYIQIKDYNNTAKQFKYILGKPDIRNSDILLFREQGIFEPYTTNTDYSVIANDKSLVELYGARCTSGEFDKDICTLGEIAQAIYLHQNISTSRILPLLEKFPKPYLFLTLANSYITQGNIPEAKNALIKALSLTNNTMLKNTIRQKLQSLL